MLKQTLILFICLMSTGIFAQKVAYGVIGATDVKMRSQANTDSESLGLFQLGEIAQILETTDYKSVPGIKGKHQWYKLKIGNKTGWIFGAFVFEAAKISTLTVKGENLELYSFTRQGPPCDMDACMVTFLGIVPDNIKSAKQIRLIKSNIPEASSYRGLFTLSLGVGVNISFVDPNNNIILYTSGEYILLSQAAIIELTWNGHEYHSQLKYSKSYD